MAARRLPSVRRTLIRIHRDIFRIKSAALYASEGPLSIAEKMVLVLEDRRFLTHAGVDIRSVAREALRAAAFMRHGGASTIDMQFVRTITGYRALTMQRKIYESLLSVLIQYHLSKTEIIRGYLSEAYFGSGIKGIEDASWSMFKKVTDALDEEEAAVIAAMLVYPRPLLPTPEWSAKVRRRADYGRRLYPKIKQSLK